jgi:hypothetical protein
VSLQHPAKRTDIELTEVEDGYVAYDETAGRVHHLNVPLVAVFDLATGDRTVDEIAAAIATEFGLAKPPLADVEAAIEQLRQEGLVS